MKKGTFLETWEKNPFYDLCAHVIPAGENEKAGELDWIFGDLLPR